MTSDSKKSAAEKAVDYIRSGMVVGLGTGSTADYFTRKLASHRLDVVCVPTSGRTKKLAEGLGLSVGSLEDYPKVDVDVDGADEVDSDFNLIKGGGGAHTIEKRVAEASKQFIVVVDRSKMVQNLGKFPIAVEAKEGMVQEVLRGLRALGGDPKVRKDFITDSGNVVIDVRFIVENPRSLEDHINRIPGVVENGVFARRRPEIVIVGDGERVDVLEKKNGR